MVALASYLYDVDQRRGERAGAIAPPEVLTIIREQLESIVTGEQTSS